MKPMPPAVITAVAVSAAVAQNNAIRAGDRATPKDWDSISPRASTFKVRAPAMASPPIANNMHGAAGEKGENDKSPIIQNSMPRNRVSSPKASIRLTTAVQPAATAAGVGEREHQEGRAQRSGSRGPVDDQTAQAQ